MSWVGALISAGGSLLGGAMGADASKKAAKQQAQVAQQQLELQRQLYNSQLSNQEPFRATGLGANNLLAQLYGLPYYDYSPAEGIGGYGYGNSLAGLPGKKKGPNIGGYSDPFIKAIGGLFDGKARPYWRDKKSGNIIFNGVNGGKGQLGGYIDPQTGEVVVNKDPYGGSAEMLTNYLRTGEGTLPEYASRFGKAVEGLRNAGWEYTPVPGEGAPAGFHEGTGKGDLSVFQNSPGYQFRLGEGLKAVQNSAAARGGLGSGNSLRAVNDYAQGTASDDFYNFVNQMNNMAGRGQTAVQGQQSAGTNFGFGASNALGNWGDARASGTMGAANSWGNAISGAAGAASDWWSSRNRNNSAYGAGGGPPVLGQPPPVRINYGPLDIPQPPTYNFW